MARIAPRQFINAENPTNILEFGPRYSPPVDNTMVMRIFHRTLGGPVSVLLDDQDVRDLVDWLTDPDGRFGRDVWMGSHAIRDTQTTADIARVTFDGPRYVLIRMWWHGSRRAMSARLTEIQATELAEWFQEVLNKGWEGWLAPEDVAPTFHGHTWDSPTMELLSPCRLCKIRDEKSQTTG